MPRSNKQDRGIFFIADQIKTWSGIQALKFFLINLKTAIHNGYQRLNLTNEKENLALLLNAILHHQHCLPTSITN